MHVVVTSARLILRRIATLGAAACLACSAESRTGNLAGVELTPAKPRPEFQLTATDGKPFDFRKRTSGQLTLLFFGYTHCPDVCPVHLANIAAALEHLDPEDRDRIRVVFVTVDPARDSLTQIRHWLDSFSPAFIGLRGDANTVDRIETALGLPPASVTPSATDYEVGHAAQVLAITPDDSLRYEYPFGIRQRDWVHDLPLLLKMKRER